MRILKKLYFTFALLFTLSSSLLAQNKGFISVKVYDASLGEDLIGATVVLSGTTNGAITDIEGNARIANLADGVYSITVSYVGYQTKTIEGIGVANGTSAPIQVSLDSDDMTLEAVVVTAEAERSSEGALLTIQKKSPILFDAISSESFSKLGDTDAAAAVRRVVGVTIESGKYVYVRGLGDRYSKSTLNSADIPGLDPNRNSVQMDLFPSNLIDNIIVYKTFSPELPGDFSGGLVNVKTKDFPDRFTFQASAGTSYNTQTSLKNDFLSYDHGNGNWLAKDDGTRAVPGLVKSYGTDVQAFPQPYINSSNEINAVTQSFGQHQFEPVAMTAPLNQTFSVSLGNQLNAGRVPVGFIGGLTYNRNFSNFSSGHITRYLPITSSDEDLERNVKVDLNDHQSVDETTFGALANISAKITPNNKIGVNLMYNKAGTDETRYQIGGTNEVNDRISPYDQLYSRTIHYTERQLTNAQINGSHVLTGLNNLEVDWFSSLTKSKGDEPDIRFLNSISTIRDPQELQDTTFLITNRSRPGRYFRTLDEQNLDNRANLKVPFQFRGRAAKFRFGGAYTFKQREYRESRYEYFVANNLLQTFDGDVSKIFNNDALQYVGNGNDSYIINGTQLSNNYDAHQSVKAAYVLFELPLLEDLKLNTGLRYEGTDMHVEDIKEDSDATKVSGDLKSNDILPSINFTYALNDNSNLRLVYSKTLARPTFREFAPLVTFAFFSDPTQVGNPNLKRTEIYNYDFRWETFPNPGEYIAFSAFYKDFHNPIINTLNSKAGGDNNLEFQYDNVARGISSGLEFEFRKSLEFITPALSEFRFNFNGSYIYSRVNLASDELAVIRVWNPEASATRRMVNQSPYVLNAGIDYEGFENGWSGGLSFNVFGPRIRVLQLKLPFIEEKPRPDLSFTVQKKFNNNLSGRFRASNLLNSVHELYLNNNGEKFVFDSYTTGQTFSLSVSYKIN
jgi:TonB-dependent receptor